MGRSERPVGEHDVRDEVVDYVRKWSERTELPAQQLVRWIGVGMSKFYDWRKRYGKVNEHNGLVPRDHWLEAWEREAILTFYAEHPLEGYRRLTYMMMDADVVAASPATVYRVLAEAGCFARWNRRDRRRARAFSSPCGHTSTGTSTSPTSTSAARFTTW